MDIVDYVILIIAIGRIVYETLSIINSYIFTPPPPSLEVNPHPRWLKDDRPTTPTASNFSVFSCFLT